MQDLIEQLKGLEPGPNETERQQRFSRVLQMVHIEEHLTGPPRILARALICQLQRGSRFAVLQADKLVGDVVERYGK